MAAETENAVFLRIHQAKNHFVCGAFLEHPVRKPTNLHLICRMPSDDMLSAIPFLTPRINLIK